MGDRALAGELSTRGIRDPRVLEAMASLDRARFVPEDLEEQATSDQPLPIGHGQTISQPLIVAIMSAALELRGHERVLEIGTGSGYQTALLAQLARDVFSIEIVAPLAEQARERLKGCANVRLRQADGYLGWAGEAPFDAILLTAAPVRIPGALLDQLGVGGRLVAPVGEDSEVQDLVRITRTLEGALHTERLLAVRFVPMTGLAEAR